jgi:hypothetical protein
VEWPLLKVSSVGANEDWPTRRRLSPWGDYATAAELSIIGSFDVYDIPVEQVFLGAVDQLLGL